jgi:hypothetical protein
VAILASCGERRPKLPPEAQAFFEKYKQIQVGMNEAEVDAILAGYPSSRGEEKRYFDYDTRTEFSHPSTTTKRFNQKPDASEWDYFVEVYFDESGYVMGKRFDEWLK